MRKRSLLGCVAAVMVVGVGCRGETEVPLVRSPLIDGFVSRESASEIEARLSRDSAKVTVVEDGKTAEKRSNFRTPLSIRVLNVEGFSHLGVQGDLRLEFVDDQLASTWFFPVDVVQFSAAIAKQAPSVAPGRPLRMHAATELRVDIDYRGRKYWAWEDVNLRQKVEQWIKKNA